VLVELTATSQEFEVGSYQFVMTEAATSNALAQMNKAPDGILSDKGMFGPRVQSGEGRTSNVASLCYLAPALTVPNDGLGPFSGR